MHGLFGRTRAALASSTCRSFAWREDALFFWESVKGGLFSSHWIPFFFGVTVGLQKELEKVKVHSCKVVDSLCAEQG